jgi:nitroreductase
MTNLVLETIKSRRSNRAFSDEQIPTTQIEAIVEAGLYAPSAHNHQSWHFTVIRDKDMIDQFNADVKEALCNSENEQMQKLGSNDKFHIFYNAPAIILISGEETGMMPETDCAAAAQNMLLAAESLGLGSCWIGFARYVFAGSKKEEYLKKFQIPNGYNPYYAIAIGKKKMNTAEAPERKAGRVTYIS